MKNVNKPSNFVSVPLKTATYLNGGGVSGSADVILGTTPLVYRRPVLNPLTKPPLTAIAPPYDTTVKAPTLIIPATTPTEIVTPTNALITKLKPSTLITEKVPQDYVPLKDPIVSDTVYTFKPLNMGANPLDYIKSIRDQYAQKPATTSAKNNWWLWILIALVVVGLIYLYKKGKLKL